MTNYPPNMRFPEDYEDGIEPDPPCAYCHQPVDVHIEAVVWSWVHDGYVHRDCYNTFEKEGNDEQSKS